MTLSDFVANYSFFTIIPGFVQFSLSSKLFSALTINYDRVLEKTMVLRNKSRFERLKVKISKNVNKEGKN